MPPKKKRMGVNTRYGSIATFSCLYKPGAINFHICMRINGQVTKKAVKKDTFKYVKKVSCRAVNINLLSEPSSFTACANGSTKKPYIFSEKK